MKAIKVTVALLLGVFLFILFLGAMGRILFGNNHPPNKAEWDAMIQRNIPPGSSKAQVKSFLDSMKVHYSYDKMDNSLYCMIKDKPPALILCDVQIEFFFDKSGKLTRYYAKETLTGP